MAEDSFRPVGLDRAKLLSGMQERGLDGIFFSSSENIFYTTGYPCLPSSGNPIVYAMRNQFPSYSFFGKDGQMTLLCWMGAGMGIEYGAEDIRTYFNFDSSVEELKNVINEKLPKGGKVGVESTFPFYAAELLRQENQPASIEIVDDLIGKLRLIKSPAEAERIRRSTQIIDRTVLELADILRLGMSRLELIQEAKTRLIKNGAGGVDHVTIAFGGANPEVALGETLERDQIVTLDVGAAYEGYVSDNRRLVYTGKIPEALRELHRKLCGIVADMGQACRPGKTFGELHSYAYDLFAREDLYPMFMHVGHSVGLLVDERWILPDDPTPVEKGMVLNIELYSPSEDAVMVGDEETYLVTGGEPEKLSCLPLEIIEKVFD